jgi:SAM-dependent methyltransferase
VGAVTNRYSQTWFDTFLEPTAPDLTGVEVAFLERVLPLPDYTRVLDLCCGSGRHALPLTNAGYRVTGVDRDAAALQRAEERLRGTTARFIQRDMRDLARLPGPFDASIIMWQSFGYFDPAANLQVLRDIAAVLRPGGRLVLDLYHRGFFERHPGVRTLTSNGRQVEETKWMEGNRLHVLLDYGEGETERMEWQLFYPEEVISAAGEAGFRRILVCREWSEETPPSPDVPRMQITLEKT